MLIKAKLRQGCRGKGLGQAVESGTALSLHLPGLSENTDYWVCRREAQPPTGKHKFTGLMMYTMSQ